jgi:hypothetical protein
MNDVREVFGTIKDNPGLLTSQIIEMLDLPRQRVEDVIWELWRDGKIQMKSDSTLRITEDGEKVFRHFYP